MMNKTQNLIQLWTFLEEEKNIGLVKRLYVSEGTFRIYALYQFPENFVGIACSFNNKVKINLSEFSDLRQLKIVMLNDTSYEDSNLLIIQLMLNDFKDIFATLCEDLLDSVFQVYGDEVRIFKVINQLNKWKSMFERFNSNGLSYSEQQGLFGELNFLQKLLLISDKNYLPLLNFWVGVDKSLRDFQGMDWALEVKSSSAPKPQKIIISSERQLDESFFNSLYLYFISVEISKSTGQTLIDKIDEIRNILKQDQKALLNFNNKLLEVGYFDKHNSIYEKRYYEIRKEEYFSVKDNFPRIKEGELRSGVCELQYSIILDMCNEYIISYNDILKKIRGSLL